MKRRITLSIALTLSLVALSLASSDSTAQAQQQQQQRFKADTGVVAVGPNQTLRLTVVGDFNDDGLISVRFRRVGYVEADNVYKIAAQDVTGSVRLMPGEAASFDIPASFLGGIYVGVRGVVETNGRDARVTAHIIDRVTGQVNSVLIGLLLP